MKNSIKPITRVLFCLAPLLLAVAVQFLVCIPVYGVSAIFTIVKYYGTGRTFQEIFNNLFALWSSSSFIIWLSMLSSIASLCIFGFWYRKKLARQQERVAARCAINLWMVLALFLLALGLQYVTAYVTSFVGAVRPDWMRAYQDLMNSVSFDETVSPVMAFYACLIAPVSEEFIFRGVTLGYAKKALPAAAAIGLQAVLFGIFHMNMIQGIYAGLVGLFLGYLCETGGSVLIAMLFHAFFNFCGTFFNSILFYRTQQPFFFLLWLTVGVLLTYGGIFLFQHAVVVRDARAACKNAANAHETQE